MSYLRYAALAAILLGGCGTESGVYFGDRRLAVNDTLRDACFAKGRPVDDDLISDLLSSADEALQYGYSMYQTQNAMEGGCITSCQQSCADDQGGECPSAMNVNCVTFCGDCLDAIVHQVYGQ
jgi:hypothetical protein